MDSFILNSGIPLVKADVIAYFSVVPMSETAATTTSIHANNSMHMAVESTTQKLLPTDDGISFNAGIERFLERKVQIHTSTWAVGTSFNLSLNPWHLFLSNPAVIKKLDNFYLVKGNLKLTFYINGTPFHAGLLLASYRYLSNDNLVFTAGGDTQIITRSQRPHLYLNASTGKGGCLCVPFFLPQNYLALRTPVTTAAEIGSVALDSISILKQLNGGNDNVTVTIFAEMTDIKLTAPTMGLVALSGKSREDFDSFFAIQVQAKDEYVEEGVISGPANAIASFAGYLKEVPVIGPFALATQIGASAVSKVAKMFGYSKPSMVADISPMRNFPVSSLALSEGVDTSQKLTLSGKQELTIDPRTVGLPPDDDMTLAHITSRESYLTQFPWDPTKTVGTTLFSCDVDPMAEPRSAVSGGTRIIPTSLSFASRPFSAWSGTIKYRFQIICSQYHRGRLAIIYDPKGPLTGDPYNTTFSTFIDLSDGRDFTVEFNWQQNVPYMQISRDNSRLFHTTISPELQTSSSTTSNGIFYVRVVNELVTPDSTTGATIAVSISGGDNFELMNPIGEGLHVFPFPPVTLGELAKPTSKSNKIEAQSGSIFDIECQSAVEETPLTENAPESETNTIELIQGVNTLTDQKPLIFYGERVTSFRQLLKRYGLVRTLGISSTSTNLNSHLFIFRAYPPLNGYNPDGFDSATGPRPYSYCGPTYLTYLRRAYAGWRGSIRWKFCPNTTISSMEVTRRTGAAQRNITSTLRPSTTNYPKTGSTGSSARKGLLGRDYASAGAARTQCRSQDALEVEIPYTVNLRFSQTANEYYSTNRNTLLRSFPGGDSFSLNVFSSQTDDYVNIDTFAAAGEDFNLFGWIGAPVVYFHDIPPVV